jgi:cyclopropane fatty-acyl-phospholipid synthase-like methyltransferase
MDKLDNQQKNISNIAIDWAKHYDYYEVDLRDTYITLCKPQNDSHFEMLKSKGARYLNKESIFCEIGFSAGITLRYALKHFNKVIGLDISSKNVEITGKELEKEGYTNFELYASDIMKFDNRFEKKFDVVSFIHGLEHFSSEDYPKVLNNIKKYLKPNGIFTGALPFNLPFKYRMCPHCSNVFEIDGHVSIHDIRSLKKVLEENGFDVIHLDNFNLNYVLKYGSIVQRIYKFVYCYLLKNPSKDQLEYIVTPKV